MRRIIRTFTAFLMSYILAASIPLFVSTVFFYQMVNNRITDAALSDAETSAAQSITAIESLLSGVNNIPISLFQNDRVTRWSIENYTLARRDVITEIRQLISGLDAVYDAFLYLRGSNQFVSGYHSVFSVDSLSDRTQPGSLFYFDRPYAQTLDTLHTIRRGEVWGAETVRIGDTSHSDAITFIQTIPPNNRYAYAVSLVLVSGRQLARLITQPEGMDFVLFGARQEKLYASREDATWQEEALSHMTEDLSGAVVVSLSGQDMIVSWARSARQGWTLLQALPLTSILDDYRHLQQSVLLFTLALSLVLAVLISAFMRWNYRPIHHLTRMASTMVPGETAHRDSFAAIREALEHLKGTNDQLSTDLTRATPQLRAHALQNLLYAGSAQGSVPIPDHSLAGLDEAHVYQVALASFPDRETLHLAADRLERSEKGDAAVHLLILDNRRELALLLFSQAPADDLAGPFLARHPLAEARIGVGPCVTALPDIAESNAKANTALDYARLRAADGVPVCYDEIPGSAFKSRTYPMALMESMSFSVAQGNTEALHAQIAQIVYMIQSEETPPYLARSLFFSTVNLLIDGMSGEVDDHQLRTIASSAMSIQRSADEMAHILVNLVDHFNQIAENKQTLLLNAPVTRALAYIEDSLASPDLSLSSVAEHVHLSVSHFSTLFKQETGYTFKEYVDRLRIARAKQLILESDLLVADVARQVGYDNSYSFSRLFKKHTGRTPAEFRQQNHT